MPVPSTRVPSTLVLLPLILLTLLLLVVAAGCASVSRPELVAEAALPSPEPTEIEIVPTRVPDATPLPIADSPGTESGAEVPVEAVLGEITPDDDRLRCLSRRQRLGQTLMPLVVQSELVTAASSAAAGEIGGVTLLGDLDANLAVGLLELQQATLLPLHIGSDEEGGVVQRLSAVLGPLPSAAEMAQLSPAEVQSLVADYAAGMRNLGVTMAFAPVVDVGGGPGIGSRSFSDDPDVVITYARATMAGFESAGVIAVLKHFPGHGRASADSHDTLPTTPPLEELRTRDLVPFVALADDANAMMVAHLSVPGLSDETPTSLSPRTINGLLRSELGYQGLVITDALNMGAIDPAMSAGEAALLALSAGADVAMITGLADVTPVLDELESAMDAGILSEPRVNEAAARVLASKGIADSCA